MYIPIFSAFVTKVIAIGAITTIVAVTSVAASAEDRVALQEEAHINETLRAAIIGARIKANCDKISGNFVVAYQKAKALKQYAIELGYSSEEIDAFVYDESEQKRVRWAATRYLKENGAVKDDAMSYCALGRAEIANQSMIGQLLSLE